MSHFDIFVDGLCVFRSQLLVVLQFAFHTDKLECHHSSRALLEAVSMSHLQKDKVTDGETTNVLGLK